MSQSQPFSGSSKSKIIEKLLERRRNENRASKFFSMLGAQQLTKEKIVDFIEHIAFGPDSRQRHIWDIIAFIFVLYNAIVIPMRACFQLYNVSYWIGPDLLADFILFIDILFNCITGFYENNLLVVQPKRMLKRYVTSFRFYVDVFAQLPFEFFAIGFGGYPWWRMNRLARLWRYGYYFVAMENGLRVNPVYIRLSYYVFLSILSMHFFACGFFFITLIQGNDYSTDMMVGKVPIVCMNFWRQYLRAFYWSVVTANGYVNTEPRTNLETFYSLLVCVIGLGIFVIIIGAVGDTISELDFAGNYFTSRMDEINSFMKYKQIPPDLAQKIRDYYTYMWKTRRTLDEGEVFSDLPLDIKIEVAMALNRDMIRKIPFFKHVGEDFIQTIALRLKPKVVLKDITIINVSEIGGEMYFINSGKVDIFSKEGKLLVTLSSGDFFGEVALLFKTRRTAIVKSKTACDLFVLEKEDFDEVLRLFPKYAESVRAHGRKRYRAFLKMRFKKQIKRIIALNRMGLIKLDM